MPAVILSAHLDDAVLSCWHVLTQPGDVTVINVFAGIPDGLAEPAWWDQYTGAMDSGELGRCSRAPCENDQMAEHLAGSADELGPGSVRGVGDWAVLNVDGARYAVSRRCRHLRADLANGKLDEDGCLVCPWHQARYDPTSGRMVGGPQAGFEKVPGLDTAFIQLTKLWPLRRAEVVERDGQVYVCG